MRHLRHPIAVIVIACCALVACGGDSPSAAVAGGNSTVEKAASDTAGGDAGSDATQPASSGGAVDCAAVKEALGRIIINWQVVIGLSNTASSEWAQIPLGSIPSFGDQLATVTAAVGSDAGAAEALTFMAGANDIVQRGVGGDAAAQEDLAAYMGTDTGVNLAKQMAISAAYQNAGCK